MATKFFSFDQTSDISQPTNGTDPNKLTTKDQQNDGSVVECIRKCMASVNVKLKEIQMIPPDDIKAVFGTSSPKQTCLVDDNLIKVINERQKTLEMTKFKAEYLNAGQKVIYDYVKSNSKKMILIQAGPGCGKSFVLKTLGYEIQDRILVCIFKHDLLHQFQHCSSGQSSVTQFFMRMFNFGYREFQAFELLLSSKLSPYDFISSICMMLRQANVFTIEDMYMFFDEYTIIPKPMLLVVLLLYKHHNLGAIFCGDKNQLQNISNSRHAVISSYDIVKNFADIDFELSKNERCDNRKYSEIIEFVTQYSCNDKLNAFGYAMVSIIFLKQLINEPNYHHLHLASTHQELTDLQHILLCRNQYSYHYYAIDRSKCRSDAQIVLQEPKNLKVYREALKTNPYQPPMKFQLYLPLVIGARYYVLYHSDANIGILKSINENESLTMLMLNNPTDVDGPGIEIEIVRGPCKEVMFEQHYAFLIEGSQGGNVYNYPIYPANFMSIHKCQGCTITGELNLMLSKANYQQLYVAMSRVVNPNQIACVKVPNQINYLVSTIVNVSKLCDSLDVDVSILQESLVNYKYYDLNGYFQNNTLNEAMVVTQCINFIKCNDPNIRKSIRLNFCKMVEDLPYVIVEQPISISNDSNLITITKITKYREIFLAASTIDDDVIRNIWLHEFILAVPDMLMLHDMCTMSYEIESPAESRKNFSRYYEYFILKTSNQDIPIYQMKLELRSLKNMSEYSVKLNVLKQFAKLNESYPMDIPSYEYIRYKYTRNNVIKFAEETDGDPNDVDSNVIAVFPECFNIIVPPFCAQVYKKFVHKEAITLPWLLEWLKKLSTLESEPEQTTNDEPKVVVNKNKRNLLSLDNFPIKRRLRKSTE